MKEINFIYGKTKIIIKSNLLSAYLENVEAAGYLIKANRCKGREGFKDVLMIGREGDFEKFFSGAIKIKEIYKQFPSVYRILFDDGEIIIYLLQNYEIEQKF